MDIQLNDFLRQIAFTEEVAHTFYLNMAAWIDDQETKEVLKAIAKEEIRHRDHFLRLQKSEDLSLVLIEEHSLADLSDLLKLPPMLLDRRLKVPEALDLAISMEKNAVRFYDLLAGFQPQGAAREVLNKILEEERSHQRIFERLKGILS